MQAKRHKLNMLELQRSNVLTLSACSLYNRNIMYARWLVSLLAVLPACLLLLCTRERRFIWLNVHCTHTDSASFVHQYASVYIKYINIFVYVCICFCPNMFMRAMVCVYSKQNILKYVLVRLFYLFVCFCFQCVHVYKYICIHVY